MECGHSTSQRRDTVIYVDMPFIRCTEEKTYASFLALIVRENVCLAYISQVTKVNKNVVLSHPYGTKNLLTIFKYYFEEIMSEQRSWIRSIAELYAS